MLLQSHPIVQSRLLFSQFDTKLFYSPIYLTSMKLAAVNLMLSLGLNRLIPVVGRFPHHSSTEAFRSLEKSNGYFPCGSSTFCITNRSTCEDNLVCKCLPGRSGPNCEPEDECKADVYPCAGGDNVRSFCVDMDPPESYKCLCHEGYDAVLPKVSDMTDPVPVEWRPIACTDKMITEDRNGSGPPAEAIAQATQAPIAPSPSPTVEGFCRSISDCIGNGFVCDGASNKCVCPTGFAKVGPNCQLENECAPGFANGCHKFATCFEEPAPYFYSCACDDGYSDLAPGIDKPGTNCFQDDECSSGTHDCGPDLTCLDRVPPLKWICVTPTPAPTNQPTGRPTAPRPLSAASAASGTAALSCSAVVLGPDAPGMVTCSACGTGKCVTYPDIAFSPPETVTCGEVQTRLANPNSIGLCQYVNDPTDAGSEAFKSACGCIDAS